jgi:di/tricarboxylate transporter
VTVVAMFVLTAAVVNTGVLIPLTKRMGDAFQKNFWLGVFFMLLIAGGFSAFMNNTPVVALLIPVLIASSAKSGLSPSKILIPLSFISMFGGLCTLVGTSTNILVSDVSEQYGFGTWGMFEMTSLGLIFFVAGTLYMVIAGNRMLPDYGKTTHLDKEYHLSHYLTNILLKNEILTGGKRLGDIPVLNGENIEIVQLTRGENKYYRPNREFLLMENDVLKIKCSVERIKQIRENGGVEIKPLLNDELLQPKQGKLRYVEAIIAPGSTLVGRLFNGANLWGQYHAVLLGIRAREGLLRKRMKLEHIVSGDTLLLAMEPDSLNMLQRNSLDFILISEPELRTKDITKGIISIVIVLSVILIATFKILPILVAAIAGSILMLLTRCISAERAYLAVDWKVIFLLAGAMSFGIALKKTGLADVIANQLITLAGNWGPVVLLSAVYLLTSLLTEAMSNNATVVLLAPIVIAMAETLGLSHKPFLMAITFAASASFMTPIGYQTNTMVYAAGNYKFRDFFKVGAGLNLLFWIIATIFIPMFFPF